MKRSTGGSVYGEHSSVGASVAVRSETVGSVAGRDGADRVDRRFARFGRSGLWRRTWLEVLYRKVVNQPASMAAHHAERAGENSCVEEGHPVDDDIDWYDGVGGMSWVGIM
jgi:hypothetical protein